MSIPIYLYLYTGPFLYIGFGEYTVMRYQTYLGIVSTWHNIHQFG